MCWETEKFDRLANESKLMNSSRVLDDEYIKQNNEKLTACSRSIGSQMLWILDIFSKVF